MIDFFILILIIVYNIIYWITDTYLPIINREILNKKNKLKLIGMGSKA